jgi:hypothetical protein
LVWSFLDFSTISYGFYKLDDLNRGVLIFCRKAPGKIQIFAIGSLVGLHRKLDRCRSNSYEGAHRRRGASEGKCSGAHGGHGVVSVGEERGRGGVSTVNRGGGGAPTDGVGIPVAGGQQSGGGVARKLPRDDVVLMVGLAGARGQWFAGTTARPSGGGSSSSPA